MKISVIIVILLVSLVLFRGYGFLIVAAGVIYFIPTIEAYSRSHPARGGIAVLNIALGWTILGWLGALAWTYSYVKPSSSSLSA